MTVFVDPIMDYGAARSKDRQVRRVFKDGSCHMFAHPVDVEELHALAAAIGMRCEWFQNDPLLPHYDLNRERRADAVAAGAAECDWRATVAMRRALRVARSVSVAALYVQRDGCYANIPGVDAWDESRDARRYAGPWPVVAHPPCQLWGNFAALNFKRWGGEHNRPGNDGGCFAAALASVRKFGGVLEHPASSNAWAAHGLARPVGIGWEETPDGWVCEVWQNAYGHLARKRTWLYVVSNSRPQDLDWTRKPGTAQIGKFDRVKPTLQGKKASATPIAFRDMLLTIARRAREVLP